MLIEKIEKFKPLKASKAEAIADICRAILSTEAEHDREKEHVWVFGLKTSLKIKYIDLVSLGTLYCSTAHPREIFRVAVMQGAASIILAHNHPGGDPSPSKEDIELTMAIKEAGNILRIPLIDHVIVTENNYWSASETGVIYQTTP